MDLHSTLLRMELDEELICNSLMLFRLRALFEANHSRLSGDHLINFALQLASLHRQCNDAQNSSESLTGTFRAASWHSHFAVAWRFCARAQQRWQIPLHFGDGFNLFRIIAGEMKVVFSVYREFLCRLKVAEDVLAVDGGTWTHEKSCFSPPQQRRV